jgi:hypothetical protein
MQYFGFSKMNSLFILVFFTDGGLKAVGNPFFNVTFNYEHKFADRNSNVD